MKKEIFFACLLIAFPSFARDIISSPHLKLDSAAKLTLASSLPYKETPVFSGLSQLHLRFEPSLEVGDWKFVAAYDGQIGVATSMPTFFNVALPVQTTQFRLWPLSFESAFGDWSQIQQLDRAFVSLHLNRLDVTVGRQAIGWGRSTLFSALDIFVPFLPLQVDQEWRVGIDAINVDWRVSDTASIQGVAVGAPNLDETAIGGRARGYFGTVDAELVLAKRMQEMVYGADGSVALGDFELHGELGIFQSLTIDQVYSKLLIGASNNFNIGSGLKIVAEYLYFGANSLSNATHTVGVVANYTFDQEWSTSLTLLQSANDGSGVVSPSAIWDFSDFGSILMSGFFAWGSRSVAVQPNSQFGAINPSFLAQLRFYD